ncbi:hypothetical protein [Jannaschia sp. CCS1]|uniref:hypothetical protein n=1 Tax=Jannaschia sp. (strain CCS1) TaxID=290400 RepID=UPI000053A2B0|nr:hypothetical protein [Jannaschia sp. CCS1]ABD54097.1 hypothetical protein Jann_1180 [Jannaschia sp. CCS1]
MKFSAFLCLAVVPCAALADSHLVAPDYLVRFNYDIAIAEEIADTCNSLELNTEAVTTQLAEVQARLAADGLPSDPPFEGVVFPSPEEQIAQLEADIGFLRVSTMPGMAYCQVGRQMRDGSYPIPDFHNIGQMLSDAP